MHNPSGLMQMNSCVVCSSECDDSGLCDVHKDRLDFQSHIVEAPDAWAPAGRPSPSEAEAFTVMESSVKAQSPGTLLPGPTEPRMPPNRVLYMDDDSRELAAAEVSSWNTIGVDNAKVRKICNFNAYRKIARISGAVNATGVNAILLGRHASLDSYIGQTLSLITGVPPSGAFGLPTTVILEYTAKEALYAIGLIAPVPGTFSLMVSVQDESYEGAPQIG